MKKSYNLIRKINQSKESTVIWLFIAYAFFGALLAFFTPADIELNNSLIGYICKQVSGVVPSIPKFASIATFPNVTKVYFSVMWLMLPVVAMILFFFLLPNIFKRLNAQPTWRFASKAFFICLAGFILFSLIVLLFMYMPTDMQAKLDAGPETMNRGKALLSVISHTRIGLAMGGGFVMCGISLMLSCLPLLILLALAAIKVFFEDVFNFSNKKQ